MFFLLEGWGECFNAELQSNPEEPRAFASVISMIAQRVKARSLQCRLILDGEVNSVISIDLSNSHSQPRSVLKTLPFFDFETVWHATLHC